MNEQERATTPGPWDAVAVPVEGGHRSSWTDWRIQAPSSPIVVATVEGLANDHAEPDARLIAAAPALHEACEAAFWFLSELPHPLPPEAARAVHLLTEALVRVEIRQVLS